MPRARSPPLPRQPTRESPRKRKRTELDLNGNQDNETTKTINAIAAPQNDKKRGITTDNLDARKSPKRVRHLQVVKAETESKPIAGLAPQARTNTVIREIDEDHKISGEGELEPTPNAIPDSKAQIAVNTGKPPKVARKKKREEEKETKAMPLAARSIGLKMYVGAHVSMAKGIENAVTNAAHIGGNAFALFLKSQRKWENPPLKDENRDAFLKNCTEHKYDAASHVVPHGSYLVNLATPDKDKSKQAYDAFIDDLHRCESLGIKYYNFHPGSTNQQPLEEAIGRLAANLNRALAETRTVVPLLENMAGGGSVIGSRFTDLRDVIAGIKPEFRSRIGICLDTCHAFAAGYDLRSPDAFKRTFKELDDTVGLKYLKAMHMNDSKAPFESKRDLHQNIGLGFLGLRAFHNIMNEERLQNIPLVLETPCDRPDPSDPKGKKTIDDKNIWAREIKLLESLIGMDPESKQFRTLEQDLSEQGRAERQKMEASISVKENKARKKLEKGQKSIGDMFGNKGSAENTKKLDTKSNSDLSDTGDL